MKWFWQESTGLKADVERHRAKEAELDALIAEIEANPEPTDLDLTALRTYRHLRAQLQQSKAEVVNKIGKSK